MAKFIKIFFVGILLVGGIFAQADFPKYTDLWSVNCQSLADCAETLVKYAISLALPVAAIFIIWSGFLFATAQGSEEKLRSAKSTLLWTIIGLAVAVGAWTLAVAFKNFFVGL
jgi:hypothetical protein